MALLFLYNKFMQRYQAYRRGRLKAGVLADTILEAKQGKTEFWRLVGEILEYYKREQPRLLKGALLAAREHRESSFTEYGSSKDKRSRVIVMIPDQVLEVIRSAMVQTGYNPSNKDFFVAFAKKYPQFAGGNKT